MQQEVAAEAHEALTAALQLLADIEARIHSCLGLEPSDSLVLANSEQLQQVPAALLQNLEATVAVIQDLQQQVQAAASPTPSSPSSSTATKGRRVPASPVCNSPTRSSRQTTPPHHSAGQTTAARSALFTKGASERAVAQWQQHKLQQEQEVSKSLTAQLDKECLLLGQLQADEAAACTAHKQVMQRTQHLGRCASFLQLVTTNQQRWKDYLAAAASRCCSSA